LREILIVGAGGFLGAISRYWLSGWVHRWAGSGFPWGTLVVNSVGCLILGALMGLLETRIFVSPEARLFLGIGILGSLTTYSTFGYETLELARRSEFTLAAANAAGSLLLGLGAVVIGRVLVRWVVA
jgi:CrcB protein